MAIEFTLSPAIEDVRIRVCGRSWTRRCAPQRRSYATTRLTATAALAIAGLRPRAYHTPDTC
jgi:hypothetical protein